MKNNIFSLTKTELRSLQALYYLCHPVPFRRSNMYSLHNWSIGVNLNLRPHAHIQTWWRNDSLYIAVIHCSYTLRLYIAVIHCGYTLRLYIAVIHCGYTLPLYIAVIHCGYTLRLYTAVIHCGYTLRLYTAVMHCG